MNQTLEQELFLAEQDRREHIKESIIKAHKEGIPPSVVFGSIQQQIMEAASETVAECIEQETKLDKQTAFTTYSGFAQERVDATMADTKEDIERIYGITLDTEGLILSDLETNKMLVLKSLLEMHPECLTTNEEGEKEIDKEKLKSVMEDMLGDLESKNEAMKNERLQVLRKEILLLKYEGVGPVECYNRLKKEAAETASMATEADLSVPPGMDKEGFLRMAWKHFLSELKEEIETVYDVKLKKKKRRRV